MFSKETLEAIQAASVMNREEKLLPGNVAIVHSEYGLQSTEKYLDAPVSRRVSMSFTEVESFFKYCEKYLDEEGAVCVNMESGGVEAVFDFHGLNWMNHRVHFSPTVDDRWKEWTAKDGNWMTQEVFGEFLEDHVEDIIDPDSASILSACMNLSDTRTQSFQSSVSLSNGLVQFKYVEDSGPAEASFPQKFVLSLRLFKGGARFRVECKLRYRIRDAKLSLSFKMMNIDKVKETIVKEHVEAVRKRLESTDVYASGSPKVN